LLHQSMPCISKLKYYITPKIAKKWQISTKNTKKNQYLYPLLTVNYV
jgi:hypothetical protein